MGTVTKRHIRVPWITVSYFFWTLDNLSIKMLGPHSELVLLPNDWRFIFFFIIQLLFRLCRCVLTGGENWLPHVVRFQLTLTSVLLFLPLACHFHLFADSVSTLQEYISAHLAGRHVPKLHKGEFVSMCYKFELFLNCVFYWFNPRPCMCRLPRDVVPCVDIEAHV